MTHVWKLRDVGVSRARFAISPEFVASQPSRAITFSVASSIVGRRSSFSSSRRARGGSIFDPFSVFTISLHRALLHENASSKVSARSASFLHPTPSLKIFRVFRGFRG
jgi:hypothetical protein